MAKSKLTTPKRKNNVMSPRSKSSSSQHKQKTKAVDLVTGKATIEYFFDPSLEMRKSSGNEVIYKTPSKGKATEDNKFFSNKFLFMPCTIIKPLDEENAGGSGSSYVNGQPYPGPTLVKTNDGSLHKITDSTQLIALHSPDDYIGVDDVLHLPIVTEASLLNTLRTRYKRDDIYTNAGPILISINPYKPVVVDGESLYSDQLMLRYRAKSSGIEMTTEESAKAPHLFQIADCAYNALMNSIHSSSSAGHLDDEDPVSMTEHHVPAGCLRNQSILVSGESGAGKTEATKIIMKYLARITRKSNRPDFIQSPDGKMIAALEDRVLSSNPLLETFGNAQTLRNDNSSRFGKFIHIHFNMMSGSITGASISNYLLEKTRITKQVEGERNYHVFYQLLSGGDDSMLQELGLHNGEASCFNYLGHQNIHHEKTECDSNALEETRFCLKSIGLSSMMQQEVFSIVAAVLHLGNIQFEEQGEDVSKFHEGEHTAIIASSVASLQKACELLGIDEDKLSEALLTKSLVVNGKTIKKRQNVVLAEDKRDAFAKLTYSSLFLWLVQRVNETLRQTSSTANPLNSKNDIGFIGVLDIYGFECFETNGYEQLLINYCNEKLQRHFNRHLFEVEQYIYVNEGVDWTYITFNDNRPCLELIEGGGLVVGILKTLDDAWAGMGTSTEKDSKFVTHLHKQFGPVDIKKEESDIGGDGHKNYVIPKFGSDRQFIIVHYAGEVRYTAEGFVEKNMDSMSNELRELCDSADKVLPKQVYDCTAGSTSSRSTIRGVSVGYQFRTSLQSLVSDLELTQPHYVRCIKPNLIKSPDKFLSGEILKQLRYSGMMEAIRIRREGYAFREDHETFYHRFSVLLSSEDLEDDESGIVQLVKVLSKRLNVSDADWQIGHSKIFLRRELADKLERLARLRVHVAARTLGRFGRTIAHRRASSLIATWIPFRLHMLKVFRLKRAANIIASSVRRYKCRCTLLTVKRGVMRLQAEQRRKNAVRYVNELRDPYCYLTYRKCQDMLSFDHGRLEQAVREKNFRLAAELEARIVLCEAAIEKKRPLTRRVLEIKIEKAQKDLDCCVDRKAYSECGPLQDMLEKLIAMRADFPTVDELRSIVRSLEGEVAAAAKRRDFSGAASGQIRLEEARNRVADVMAADGDEAIDSGDDIETSNKLGFESRAQLEQEMLDLKRQIEKAVESKNFTKASSLQQVLNERKNLRNMFPSIDELQVKLSNVIKLMNDAVSRKDYSNAGLLNEEISALEKKIEFEKASLLPAASVDSRSKLSIIASNGVEKFFVSRVELEKAIADATASVSKSVVQRDFKRAESLQSDVDSMIKFRDDLPSLIELQQELAVRKKEMNAAIANKHFARADELDKTIELLALKIEGEMNATNIVELPTKFGDATAIISTPSAPGPISIGSQLSASKLIPSSRSVLPTEVISDPSKSVSKLRPSPPVISLSSDSILSVAKMLSKKRAKASIVVNPTSGELVGIVTSTDFTRRVIAKRINPRSAIVESIMTPSPTCVSMNDSAVDALTTMVENHFRHLPVVENDGSLAGVLDISKCLTEAIHRLETNQEEQSLSKSISSNGDVVKNIVKNKVVDRRNSASLELLLNSFMLQAGGAKIVPTLRSILHQKPSTIVRPDQTIREASFLMTEQRHAALVVNASGDLMGVFSFKDMMTRAIAKELDLDNSPVSMVMTEDPVTVSPEMNVIEALYAMVDSKVLTLPVCENNGAVVGLVDVMDLIYGCGGSEGWRSVFTSAMELDDDLSDVTSIHSAASGKRSQAVQSEAVLLSAVKESVEERPVAKLRPSKPTITTIDYTLLRAAKLLASKRSSAALIVNQSGELAGILTDKDITCRAVVKLLHPSTTFVSEVMTPNPTCVSMNDAAMDALNLMVENRFRHLPVLDDQGAVVGTLDIVKCLSSIIKKLEHVERNSERNAKDIVQKVVDKQGASGAQAAALQSLLGNLLSQVSGTKSVPTLRSLLQGKPSTSVRPTSTIREVGMVMAEHRHGALIVNHDGQLIGIFTFKDMMIRAIANELDIDSVMVREVMTSHPEAVPPDMTVLEALQIMADNKFLTLPVCESSGKVLGVVDALDVIYGCGGAEGWRSVFSSAMEAPDDETSFVSGHNSKSITSAGTGLNKAIMSDKKVKNLRPSKPAMSLTTESIVDVAQLLQRKRGDSSLVVSPNGSLAGIVTDTDFTRRAVARKLDLDCTSISEIMTSNPSFVSVSDSAIDALTTMIENHFRHLPVVDDDGAVVGILDISKCLNDAIERLERQRERTCENTAGPSLSVVLEQVARIQSSNVQAAAALQALLGKLMSQAVGGKSLPTLRSLVQNKPATIVRPTTSVREAGMLMAENRKAALVVEDGRLVGIFGFKDMMTRCIAAQLDLDMAPIGEVMTPDPECVTPDSTVLQALYIMYDHKILTLPLCESNGKVVGLVDVMDVIYGCGGSEGWRTIFTNAMDACDDDTKSAVSKRSRTSKDSKDSKSPSVHPTFPVPTNLEFNTKDMESSLISQRLFAEDNSNADINKPVFKVSDLEGKTHRIKCDTRIDSLMDAVSLKTLIPRSSLLLQYVDEEGDTVTMSCDDDVIEAWSLAKKSESKIAKVKAIVSETNAKTVKDKQFMLLTGVVGAAAIGGLAFLFLRPKAK